MVASAGYTNFAQMLAAAKARGTRRCVVACAEDCATIEALHLAYSRVGMLLNAEKVFLQAIIRKGKMVASDREHYQTVFAQAPGAELEHAPQQQVHDDGAAMALQLEHVLAGERRRGREIERDALVDRLGRAIHEAVQLGRAWRRHATEQGRGDFPAARSRDPHDADAATSRSRGDGRDRAAITAHHLLAGARRSATINLAFMEYSPCVASADCMPAAGAQQTATS